MQHASQLRDANEANPSAENGSFADWAASSHFVLCVLVYYGVDACNKSCTSAHYKLQWSDDAGSSWHDVAAATAIAPSDSTHTTLQNGATVTQRITVNVPAAACSGGYEATGVEVAGTATSNFVDSTSEHYCEIHWALDPALADGGTEYSFRIVNADNSDDPFDGTIASTVTMAIASQDATPQPGHQDMLWELKSVGALIADVTPIPVCQDMLWELKSVGALIADATPTPSSLTIEWKSPFPAPSVLFPINNVLPAQLEIVFTLADHEIYTDSWVDTADDEWISTDDDEWYGKEVAGVDATVSVSTHQEMVWEQNSPTLAIDASPSQTQLEMVWEQNTHTVIIDCTTTAANQQIEWELKSTLVLLTTVSPVKQVMEWEYSAPTILADCTVTPAKQEMVWEQKTTTVVTGQLVEPTYQNMLWEQNAPTVIVDCTVAAANQQMEWQQKVITLVIGQIVHPAVQLLEWEISSPQLIIDASPAAAKQTIKWAAPKVPTITAGKWLYPTPLEIKWQLNSPTELKELSFSPSIQLIQWQINEPSLRIDCTVSPTQIGAVWTIKSTVVIRASCLVSVAQQDIKWLQETHTVDISYNTTVPVSTLELVWGIGSVIITGDRWIDTADDEWVSTDFDVWEGIAGPTPITVPVSQVGLVWSIKSDVVVVLDRIVYVGDCIKKEDGTCLLREDGVPIFTEDPLVYWKIAWSQQTPTVNIVSVVTVQPATLVLKWQINTATAAFDTLLSVAQQGLVWELKSTVAVTADCTVSPATLTLKWTKPQTPSILAGTSTTVVVSDELPLEWSQETPTVKADWIVTGLPILQTVWLQKTPTVKTGWTVSPATLTLGWELQNLAGVFSFAVPTLTLKWELETPTPSYNRLITGIAHRTMRWTRQSPRVKISSKVVPSVVNLEWELKTPTFFASVINIQPDHLDLAWSIESPTVVIDVVVSVGDLEMVWAFAGLVGYASSNLKVYPALGQMTWNIEDIVLDISVPARHSKGLLLGVY